MFFVKYLVGKSRNGTKAPSLVFLRPLWVLDLDKHLSLYSLKSHKLTNGLYGRRSDFLEEIITDCYIVYQDKAVKITSVDFAAYSDKDTLKQHIESIIEKLRT